jgi:copper(I)-binding protein
MRLASLAALLLLTAGAAFAHSYRVGVIEIIHPAIKVPDAGVDSTCANATIVNHGAEADYLVKAEIALAGLTQLVRLPDKMPPVSASTAIAITPGAGFNLYDHQWCILLSGVTASLEADAGLYPGLLVFRHGGPIAVEFMVDYGAT